MTDYLLQAELAEDIALRVRATACAAGAGIPDPAAWVQQHIWQLATTPGWCCRIADGGVITDAMIQASVTSIYTAETPPATPEDEPPTTPVDPESPAE